MMTNTNGNSEQPANLALVPRPETALARPNPALQFTNMKELMDVGALLAGSGYFADATKTGQAVAKMLAGRELGIAPVASLTGIYIVKGHVTLGANLIAAQIKRSGVYNYKVTRLDHDICEIVFTERGELCGTSTFTRADAEAAGLATGDVWKKYPRNMLYARAMSNGARWFTPDVFSGPVYTPDELGAEVIMNEQGDLIQVKDVTPQYVEPPASASEAQVAEIVGLGQELQKDEAALLEWLKIDSWQDLPAPKADKAIAKLKGYVEAAQASQSAGEVPDETPTAQVVGAPAAMLNDVAEQLKRLKLSDELGNELHDLVLPEHTAGTPMNEDQGRRLLLRLRKFKNPDAVVDWVGLQKDEARHKAQAGRVEVFPREEMQVLAPERTVEAQASNSDPLFDDTDDL